MTADRAGNLFIADQSNNRIRKVNAAGVITTIAGNGRESFSGDGGKAIRASLDLPVGVAVDVAGNLYIADTSNSRLRRVDASGRITTIAGNGTAGFSGDGGAASKAQLDFPAGVAVDQTGNLYIADTHNSRIRRVAASARTP